MRRRRLAAFAAYFHRESEWEHLAARLPSALELLGFALTLTEGAEPRGAIYFRAFGLRVSEYAALASAASGRADADRIRSFGASLLGGDVVRPTRSAALSFHFGPDPGLPAELEFCAHCLYRDDAEAEAALERLFAHAGLDPTPYRALVTRAVPSCDLRRDGHDSTPSSAPTKAESPRHTPCT